jgi:hypothetical protein
VSCARASGRAARTRLQRAYAHRPSLLAKRLVHAAHVHLADKLSPEGMADIDSFSKALLASIAVFRKYRALFNERLPTLGSDSPLFGCGWLLFLAAKGARARAPLSWTPPRPPACC